MALTPIGLGSAPNDDNGDTLRAGGTKINLIISELWDTVTSGISYLNGKVGIGRSDALQTVHIKTDQGDPQAVAGNYDHDYYGLTIESEDAIVGLVSIAEGGHGSGVDMMEVDAGVLEDKWTMVRRSSLDGSRLQFKYGTLAKYSDNEAYVSWTTDYHFHFLNPASKLVIGTDVAKGHITMGNTDNTITTDTEDASDTKRIQLCGGGTAAQSRGAYINVSGNEFSGQEGNISIIAGDSTLGRIEFYTDALVKRGEFLKDGGFRLIGLKSGANQGASGAGINEIWVDTADQTLKLGG